MLQDLKPKLLETLGKSFARNIDIYIYKLTLLLN
ncbi:hypothetical protein NUACC26_028170 [Scytonema sp. NUACC26]